MVWWYHAGSMLVKKVEERSKGITCKGKVRKGFQDNIVSKKSKAESRRKEWRIYCLEGGWETVAWGLQIPIGFSEINFISNFLLRSSIVAITVEFRLDLVEECMVGELKEYRQVFRG